MKPTKEHKLSFDDALHRVRHYCAKQERSHQQVRDKLYHYGLYPDQVERGISLLIQENFLNEQRFAEAFFRGKFNQKQWGRIKIKQAISKHQISEYCLKKGLATIDEDDYLETLAQLAEKKWSKIKEKNPYIKRKKLANYLIQKGYESYLVWEEINTNFSMPKS